MKKQPKQKGFITLNIRDRDLHQQLKLFSVDQKLSIIDVVESALKQHIANKIGYDKAIKKLCLTNNV